MAIRFNMNTQKAIECVLWLIQRSGTGSYNSSSGRSSSSSSSVAEPSSSSVDCSGFVDGTEREHYGRSKAQFCDERDGKRYVYVKIDAQTWMAENLNYNASGSVCYDNSEANCTTYGRLYDWATAMALPSSCNTNTCTIYENHQGICSEGWHIPSYSDYYDLLNYDTSKLKTTSGWGDGYGGGNGTDEFGFAALPSGSYSYSGSFSGGGIGTACWWLFASGYDRGSIGARWCTNSWGGVIKSNMFSVRCVKD
jgi:uncharacterized protein (TIGR02145 family)